jgi:heteromeric Ino2p/Ino4p transcription factor
MDAVLSAGITTADKPRLSEQEKKNNHIESEQKRRRAIREGFDELAEMIPGCKGQGRSEAVVLEAATAHVKQLLAERYQLMTKVNERALSVDRWQLDDATMQFARDAAQAEMEEAEAKRAL